MFNFNKIYESLRFLIKKEFNSFIIHLFTFSNLHFN